ncbi:MAG: ACP S-malonyltransferase [Bdellovibrionota bacterium]
MKRLGLFPGQGSQTVGMGSELKAANPEAAELFNSADQILGYSLSSLCLEGPAEKLVLTENAQPAILLVSTICHRLSGVQLDTAAGHSLGEYSALVAAGVIRFEDALQLVHKRGRYMQEAVEPGAGKMVAVMGPTEPEIRKVIGECTVGVAEIANLNSPGQTVVAGDVAGVDAFAAAMQAAGAKIIPLNVSAPFHCRLMRPAADKLASDLDAISFSSPKFPVISNVTARPIESGDQARELLKQQVCAPVRWTESMEFAAEGLGATHSIEFGAGGVLTKLLKRIRPEIARAEVSNPESLEKLKAAA